MDLEDFEDQLDNIRPDDRKGDWALRLVMAMLGNVSEGLMRMESVEEEMDAAMERTGHSEEEILEALDVAKEDMIGALFVAVAELAHEEDVSISEAVETRVERMRKAKEQRKAREKWEEAGILNPDSGKVDTDLDSEDDWTFQ